VSLPDGDNGTCSNNDSGKELSKFINAVIEENNTWTVCRQVILVTHSMGGLVARSACKLHGAEGKVLGVVHGAQPAYGAPAAYQRMKHGFRDLNGSMWDWLVKPVDKIAQRVLGNNGKAVTILLANMPGGLELLPNQLYTTNDGSAQWLHCTDHRGASVSLPRSDPYGEIYEEKGAAWRLVNPKWLGDKASSGFDKEVRHRH
jgi:pimeloyl-ACP methyl ester carboxylesterase